MNRDRYLRQPNYLRFNGRPVLLIYDVDQLLAFGGVEAVKSSLSAMRASARRSGLGGLHLVAVYSEVSAAYVQLCRDLGFDSFCAYTYAGTRYPPVRWDSQNIPYESCVTSCGCATSSATSSANSASYSASDRVGASCW